MGKLINRRSQLLTHTSGAVYDWDDDLKKHSKHIGRTASAADLSIEGWDTPLLFSPGSSWMYGTGLDWAGVALQQVTGRTLGEYMAEHIFSPLGMADTTFHPASLAHRTAGRFAPITHRVEDTGLLEPEDGTIVPHEPPVHAGGGGLYSTAADYARLLRVLLADDGAGVLSPAAVDEVFRPQLTEEQRKGMKRESDRASEPPEGEPAEFPDSMKFDHGLAGLINMEDNPGKRRKGSLRWGGLVNPIWVSRRYALLGLPATDLLLLVVLVGRSRGRHSSDNLCEYFSTARWCPRPDARRARARCVWRAAFRVEGRCLS